MTDKDSSVIPEGDYCYSYPYPGEIDWGKRVICPYWSEVRPTTHKPGKGNRLLTSPGCGHCAFLGKSDDDFRKEGRPHSLLWDQVKECSVNPRRRKEQPK